MCDQICQLSNEDEDEMKIDSRYRTDPYGIKDSNSHGNNFNNTKLLHSFFHNFSDAAHTNSDNYKSIGGYVFIAAWGVITWCSKKQMFTTLSTTDAKYSALSEAVCEAY